MADSRASKSPGRMRQAMNFGGKVLRASRRRRLALVGCLLTIVVLFLQLGDRFARLDNFLYDQRVNLCQSKKPRVAPLMHVDIDDGSIEAIGGWPWRRGILAQIIDELHLAGAKAIAMDVLFTEPQDALASNDPPKADAQQTSASERPVIRPTTQPVGDDAKLAAALSTGNAKVILPVSFAWATAGPQDSLDRAMADALGNTTLLPTLDLTPAELAEKLKPMLPEREQERLEERIKERLPLYLPKAMSRRALEAISSQQDYATFANKRLPADVQLHHDSMLQEMLRRRWFSAYALHVLQRFPIARPDFPIQGTEQLLVPIPALGASTWGVGFTDYLPGRDGVVRSVPLLVEYTDNRKQQVFAQFGVVLACAMLDVRLESSKFQIRADSIVISTPDRQVVIPTHNRAVSISGETVPYSMDIPWSGGRDWRKMYDADLHMPISEIWQIRKADEVFQADSAQLVEVVRWLAARRDPDAVPVFTLRPTEDQRLREFCTTLTRDRFLIDTVNGCRQSMNGLKRKQQSGVTLDPEEARKLEENATIVDVFDKLPALVQATLEARDLRDKWRKQLERRVSGNAVIVGWTATGAIADSVATSLHPMCPGSVAHGVIYNSIMTGQLWRRVPQWATYLLIAALGLLTTWLVTRFRPFAAFIAALALVLVYLIVNGVVLFGKYSYLLDLAGPIMAVMIVWSGCSVAYAAQRFRISKALGVYVDPSLIDYVQEQAAGDIFEGRSRELTVVFSDIQGFTTLTEKLKEGITRLLSEYMGAMIPVIRQNNGLVHKLLGDGIMFSFGALRDDADHAANAMRAVLRMQQALTRFNSRRRERHQHDCPGEEFHEILMRCGVSSGRMTAGNAGPKDFKDFTVLGDMVNLAARLETANKACGTRILVTAETFRRVTLKDFILMPIGNLKVRGRNQAVMSYELLGEEGEEADRADPDLPQKRKMIKRMETIVQLFDQRQFDFCKLTIEALKEEMESWPWARRYESLLRCYEGQCACLNVTTGDEPAPSIEVG